MKTEDEYKWSSYTAEYSNQLEREVARENDFFVTGFREEDGRVVFDGNLHPNWMEIYTAAYELKPKTVFECGAGGCYHLKNIAAVLPGAWVGGADLLASQLEYGKKFSSLGPEISENLSVMDMTKERPVDTYEFVFSQAVVMHLSTDNAVRFLENMRDTSSKYVFMVEGVRNHANWYDLVRGVFGEDWEFTQPNRYVNNSILLVKKDKKKGKK